MHSSNQLAHPGSSNRVTTVLLHDISIVCLWIDGQERLCLAQISNTLLKSFSYNEIHNRRVALGITCVQCTPVQLEILRRSGAMPVSSRRCGMITKHEAERLVKSFLQEVKPPKLPEGFAFDVKHDCGWGCRGHFYPSRYNSSRAKCVKCKYCNLFFSANKFIFHFHRVPEAKYHHPDAANFNSWRRHLQLDMAESPPEHLRFAWEDVKAMFNGGGRKRMMSPDVKKRHLPRIHSAIQTGVTGVNQLNHLAPHPRIQSEPVLNIDCNATATSQSLYKARFSSPHHTRTDPNMALHLSRSNFFTDLRLQDVFQSSAPTSPLSGTMATPFNVLWGGQRALHHAESGTVGLGFPLVNYKQIYQDKSSMRDTAAGVLGVKDSVGGVTSLNDSSLGSIRSLKDTLSGLSGLKDTVSHLSEGLHLAEAEQTKEDKEVKEKLSGSAEKKGLFRPYALEYRDCTPVVVAPAQDKLEHDLESQEM